MIENEINLEECEIEGIIKHVSLNILKKTMQSQTSHFKKKGEESIRDFISYFFDLSKLEQQNTISKIRNLRKIIDKKNENEIIKTFETQSNFILSFFNFDEEERRKIFDIISPLQKINHFENYEIEENNIELKP
ncbi:hypothetical protein [Sulfurimonas sp.]|uniref:hypothetical protein n=1 Tax=Sulfurimonas sp. TaxID=2022749 RepID=UPI002AB2D1CD|nr:hypothetical protein [Sulfurimonas sp.]